MLQLPLALWVSGNIMRSKILIFGGIIICGLALALGIWASVKRATPDPAPLNPVSSLTTPQTLSDRQLQKAQRAVEQAPTQAESYNDLCAAWMKKARETGDFALNAKADEALNKSLSLAPDNYNALKLKAALLLSYHRFAEALEVARRTQGLMPNDYENYGAITDALVELGDYDEAIAAAQTMVDLRPNSASYARVSYLRALHGDTKGAIEAMRVAAESANPQDPEAIAWCRVHLGDELMNAGKLKEAEREYDFALFTYPDYHLALAAKGRARLAAGDTEQAVKFYQQAQARVPLPETAIALGDLYTKLGRTEEARQQYALVDFIEKSGSANNTYSRLLALFWADQETKLDAALMIARRERAARRDVYTCDALAWCLYKKGQYEEAGEAMREALRLGTRDPRLLYHAGMIENQLGKRKEAVRYLNTALQINPSFDVLQADTARRTLLSMKA